jgi:hypothetical protein
MSEKIRAQHLSRKSDSVCSPVLGVVSRTELQFTGSFFPKCVTARWRDPVRQ